MFIFLLAECEKIHTVFVQNTEILQLFVATECAGCFLIILRHYLPL